MTIFTSTPTQALWIHPRTSSQPLRQGGAVVSGNPPPLHRTSKAVHRLCIERETLSQYLADLMRMVFRSPAMQGRGLLAYCLRAQHAMGVFRSRGISIPIGNPRSPASSARPRSYVCFPEAGVFIRRPGFAAWIYPLRSVFFRVKTRATRSRAASVAAHEEPHPQAPNSPCIGTIDPLGGNEDVTVPHREPAQTTAITMQIPVACDKVLAVAPSYGSPRAPCRTQYRSLHARCAAGNASLTIYLIRAPGPSRRKLLHQETALTSAAIPSSRYQLLIANTMPGRAFTRRRISDQCGIRMPRLVVSEPTALPLCCERQP